ncbi:MAG TPA: alpha/beta fold hydrolase [Candidatus Acidoferrum sp.]|nr:alpha/beta fold hydrolase [Candidatus Acidoferrum sp.]
MKPRILISLSAIAIVLSFAGCVAPIGADRVTTRQAYQQVAANALRTGKPSADTVSILHRFELDGLAGSHPDEAVRRLHEKALSNGQRDLMFALAELSYVAGDQIRRSLKPWDQRDPRDYYLGSAVYAWLFLFGEGKEAPPGPFDRRFRDACDFYNYSLGLAFTDRRNTNGVVRFDAGLRRLPVGEIQLQIDASRFPAALTNFERILLADQFRVRGLSVRNRQPGVGAPLICARKPSTDFTISGSAPATALLRGPASLAQLVAGAKPCSLELYFSMEATAVTIGANSVPLETDLTTFRAYTLNEARIWKLGNLAFLAPPERVANQLIMHQPYDPDRIPVVLVHGTFSSPVTWAEMGNTLIADPAIRRRYQFWSFIYGSGNPLVASVADFRRALQTTVQRLDPQGTNAMLRQMVIIGHSQGGLLTKCTAVDAGDRLWRVVSTNRLENLDLPEADRTELRQTLYLKPLPFVKCVVFIATPHRGSYLSGSLARRLAQKFVALPRGVVTRGTALLRLTQGSQAGEFLQARIPTSLDGMSPRNPALLAIADLPVAPPIKAHSIIPVQGNGDPREGGRDGVVAYSSAHVDYVESELVVRSYHSCLNQPAVIEEVRRILYEQL